MRQTGAVVEFFSVYHESDLTTPPGIVGRGTRRHVGFAVI
jgi:hypothetical protein